MNSAFPSEKRSIATHFCISFVVHVLCIFAVSRVEVAIPHLRKHSLLEEETFTSTVAKKQESLNKTFQRFYPVFAKKDRAHLFAPKQLEEGSLQIHSSEKEDAFSIGEDQYTLVNSHFNAPDVWAASLPSELPAQEEIAVPRNIPIKSPLTLDEAHLKKEIQEASALVQKNLLGSVPNANQILSSKISLGSVNENLNPFNLSIENTSQGKDPLFTTRSEKEIPVEDLVVMEFEMPDIETFLHNDFKQLYIPENSLAFSCEDSSLVSEHFNVHTAKTYIQDEQYTLFSITITPKTGFAFQKLSQDLVFLVDRSNSIDQQVFDQFKKTVAYSLDILPQGELFNIAIFDSKVKPFSETSAVIEKKTLLRAKTYLETRSHGGMFASTNLFLALSHFMEDPNKVQNIFLFSDGDTFLKDSEKIKTLLSCVSKNPNVIVHCVASGTENNLPLLRLISRLNRGKLIYEKDPKKLSSRFVNSLAKLTSVIATEVTPSVEKTDPKQKIAFFMVPHLITPLYSQQSFTIYGIATNDASFDLFLQGKGPEGPVTIKKQISLEDAVQKDSILEKVKMTKQLHLLEKNLYKQQNASLNSILD